MFENSVLTPGLHHRPLKRCLNHSVVSATEQQPDPYASERVHGHSPASHMAMPGLPTYDDATNMFPSLVHKEVRIDSLCNGHLRSGLDLDRIFYKISV